MIKFIKKKWFPYLLILLGFLVLTQPGLSYVAGGFVVLGIVMIMERIWPEKWEKED